MRKRLFVPLAVVAAMLLLAAGLIAGVRGTAAQDTASPTADQGHPIHIHDGTCASLGGVVYPLNNLMAPDMSATPMAGEEMDMASPMAGTETTNPMAGVDMSQVESWSETKVQASLD